MKVILLQDVPKLGKAGTVKEVRNGYGFNFLIPQRLAELATAGALKNAEKMQAERAKAEEAKQSQWNEVAQKLEGKKVSLKAKAEDGKLFGSVSKAEIASALKNEDIEIEENQINLPKPIKEVGEFAVEALLGSRKVPFSVTVSAQ